MQYGYTSCRRLARVGNGLKASLLAVAAVVGLAGCSNIEHKPRGYAAEAVPPAKDGPRKIVIFFDGTANDEGSDTNVKRLHSLVSLQDRPDISSLYLLGVGTNSDVIGAMSGWGINARVRIAYEFILNHYEPARKARAEDAFGAAVAAREADEIYIFGFSRGAYSARILTTMLDYAGLVTHKDDSKHEFSTAEMAKKAHEATLPPPFQDLAQSNDRRGDVTLALKKEELVRKVDENNQEIRVPVKVLGLWDTVEALGVQQPGNHLRLAFRMSPPDLEIDIPNKRYGERLCNVERVYHAVSIDDDRATIFTPLLMSRKHLFEGCAPGEKVTGADGKETVVGSMIDEHKRVIPGRLQEVWFSGAHADVGGGYLNSTLSGVSLNWMLSRISDTGILPSRLEVKPTADEPRYVREDIFGTSHDPRSGHWGIIYPLTSRDLVTFATDDRSIESYRGKICVHKSALVRRSVEARSELTRGARAELTHP